jgi:hypothetical protein
METGDIIQTIILFIMFLSFIFLIRQIVLQNRIFKAQLMRDRFEMYWRTYDPVTEDQISELKIYPRDYMDPKKYETFYKDKPESIKKYIMMMKLYDYLAFINGLRKEKLSDPLGNNWSNLWTSELIDEKEFMEIHNFHKIFYPDFAEYIDKIISKKTEEKDTNQ